MQAAVEFAAFLELSDDNILDPDAAVRQQEHLSWIFRNLSKDDIQRFRNFIHDLAVSEEAAEGQTKRVKFLSRLAEYLFD
jgi:hypothetical protein